MKHPKELQCYCADPLGEDKCMDCSRYLDWNKPLLRGKSYEEQLEIDERYRKKPLGYEPGPTIWGGYQAWRCAQ